VHRTNPTHATLRPYTIDPKESYTCNLKTVNPRPKRILQIEAKWKGSLYQDLRCRNIIDVSGDYRLRRVTTCTARPENTNRPTALTRSGRVQAVGSCAGAGRQEFILRFTCFSASYSPLWQYTHLLVRELIDYQESSPRRAPHNRTQDRDPPSHELH
jgi:hypothetical protein